MVSAAAIENGTVSLLRLTPGAVAEVVALTSRDPGRLMKLSALGLVPGSVVRLAQRSPAFVIWVGETQLSFDEDVAREILLQVPVDQRPGGGGLDEDHL